MAWIEDSDRNVLFGRQAAGLKLWALPGGKAVIFTMPDGKQPGIYWLSLATKKRLLLSPQVSRAIYDPHGFLLWGRDGSVVARRFDAKIDGRDLCLEFFLPRLLVVRQRWRPAAPPRLPVAQSSARRCRDL